MIQARTGAAAVLLSDGRILITGGSDSNGVPQASAEVYDPGTAVFTAMPMMNVPRANHAAILLTTGDVLVTGGLDDAAGDYSDTAEIYTVATQKWTLLQSSLGTGLEGHAMAGLSDGNVLISGGTSTAGPVTSLLLFKISDQSISPVGAMITARSGAAAAETPDGRVLIAGGNDINGAVLASTEIFVYNQITGSGTISAGPLMTSARAYATATATYDGVAVIGGNNGSADIGTAEIFSQWTNTFRVVAGGTPTSHHFAAMLPHNGAILAMGGTAGAAVSLLQPWVNNTAGAFIAGASSLSNHAGGIAAPVNLGSLLAAGGQGAAGPTAELYWFPTISTDQPDYAPGTPVVMTGTGFQAGEIVDLHLHEWVNQTVTDLPNYTATADANGSFSFTGYAPTTTDVGARYHLTAVGITSGLQAETVFTDAGSANLTITASPSAAIGGTFNLSYLNNGGANKTQTGQPTPETNLTTQAGSAFTISSIGTHNGCTWIDSSAGLTTSTTGGGSASVSGTTITGTEANNQQTLTVTLNFSGCTTTTTVTSSGTPSAYGQQVTFTATVSSGGSPVTSAAGEIVTFKNGSTTLGTGILNGSGQAIYTTTSNQLPAGSNSITAVYGGDSSFSGSTSSAFTQDVNQAVLTIAGITANNKVYDGTSAASPSTRGTTVSGAASGDTVTINTTNAAGVFIDRNAGSNKQVTISGITFTCTNTSGNCASDYTLTQPITSANITPKALTYSGLSAPASRIYDGTTAATVSGTATLKAAQTAGSGSTSDGKPYTVDSVSLTGTATGTYNSKDVATATTVTFGGLSLTGTGNTNYTLTALTQAATITSKALTYSGLSAGGSRIYDGTTSATATGTAALQTAEAAGSGSTADGKPYTVDSVSLTGTATGSYNSKDVTTATTVTFGGESLTGTGSTNYTLSALTQAATITPKALTYNGLSVAATKIYDGTTSAAVTGTAVLQTAEAAGSGNTSDGKPYIVDSVSLTGTATATYNSKDVATANAVMFGGLSITGTGFANYTLTASNQPATITSKTLTVSGITANNKVYDSTTAATLNTSGATLSGVVSGDTSNVSFNTSGATGTFASSNAGSGISVTVSGLTLTGSAAGNYQLGSPQETTTANINKATANVSVTPYTVTYDGSAHTATATITGVNGETGATVGAVNLSNTTHTTAGNYTTDSWSFTGAANYNDIGITTITDTINKAAATVVVTPYTVTYDASAHTATATITGVNGETGATVGTVNLSNTTHTAAGIYTTDSWSFTGAANYKDIASTTITDAINKATATVVVTPYTVAYDGSAHTATATITGVNGETGATVGTVNLSNTTHMSAGNYTTDSWSFTGGGNYNDIATTTITDTITKANATVVVTPYTVTYDGSNHTAAVTSITGVNSETGATVGTVDVSNTSHVNAGTYATDSWTFTGTANYNSIAATIITDIINKANASVSVTPYNVTYDATAHTATGTATGVGGVALAGLDLSGTTHTNAGTYPDTWSFTDSTGNYNNVGPTSITDVINKATANITVTPYSVTYDGSAHTAAGTASGVGSVNLSADLNLTGTTHTVANTYTNDSWAFHDVSGNYADASGTISDLINAATLTINPTGGQVKAYGTDFTAFTGTTIGLLGSDSVLVTYGSAGAPAAAAAGGYDITVANASFTSGTASNYHVVTNAASGGLTVVAAAPVLPGPQSGTSTYGTPVTLTVRVSAPSGTGGEIPQGNVQFQFVNPNDHLAYNICADGTLQVQTPTPASPCTVPLDATGTASVTTTNLPAGMTADQIAATYDPGDGNYVSETTSINYTVSQASTQATLNIAPAATPTYGDTITLASVVSDSSQGSTGMPTGTVQFAYSTDNGANWINIGSAVTLDSTGSVQTTTAILPAGSPEIKAVYSGDSNFLSTSSGATVYQINPKQLTVSGITASDKPYDGTTAATLKTANKALVGIIAPDSVTLTGTASGVFTDANAGTGKTVNVTGLSLIGDQASDYILVEPKATASISQVPLTVTAPNLTVAYGDPVPNPITPSITGFVNGEGLGALSTQPVCTTTYTQGANAGSTQTTSCSGGADTNYTFTYKSASLTVNKADAKVTVSPYSLTYDAHAHTATGTATGVGSVDLSASLTLSNTMHTNAGDYPTDSWTFSGGTNYNDQSGTIHDVINKANATITVTPYAVTYDSTAHSASGSATGVDGSALAGLNLSGTTHTNAGSYSDSWSFTDTTGNYNNVGSTIITDVINKANASVAVTPYSVTYDATAHTATGTVTGVGGVALAGLNLSGTTHTNAGTYPDTWTFTDTTGNYNNIGSTSITDVIKQATASITIIPYNVIYDGSAHTAAGTATGVGGVNLAADLILSGTSHALTGTYSTDSWTFHDPGGNYADVSATISDLISPATLTITPTGGQVKAYGTVFAAFAGTTVGLVGTDSVSVTYSSAGVAAAAIAGSYDITVANVSFTSGSAGNYHVVTNTAAGGLTVVAAMPVLPPTQTGNSTYGTPITLTVTVSAPSGTGGEVPTGNVMFQFINPNDHLAYNICADGGLQVQTPPPASRCTVPLNFAGTASVTTSNLPASMTADQIAATYDPGDGNYVSETTSINYIVSQANTQATLNIAPAATPTYGDTITLSSVVSDSSQGSTGMPTGTVQFAYSTDNGATWTNIGSSATALTPNTDPTTGATATTTTTAIPAGSPQIKAVYSGDSNFLSTSSGTTVYQINPKQLTVSGITASDKPYDGSTTATLNTASEALVGVISPDAVTLTGTASGTFTDANAGTGKTVNVTGLSLTGAQSSDYTLTEPTATASITKVQLTVTAPSLSVNYGNPVPANLTPTITGFVNGEGTGALSIQPACTTTYTQGSNAGSAQTTTCSGGEATNYSFTYVVGTVTVNKANATVVVTPYTVTYDGHSHTAVITSITGVNGQTGATVGSVDVSNTTHTSAGTYSSDCWTFTGTANYYNISATTITDTINKANATVVVTPYTVTYDGTAHTATATITGVNGESGATVGTVDVSNTTHTNAGSYASDYWSFTGAANYNNLGNTTIIDTINKADVTIHVTPYAVIYDGSAHTAAGTATGVGGVNLSADLTLSATTHTHAGSFTDTWTFTDNTGNYNNTSGTSSDNIAPLAVTLTAGNYNGVYDSNTHALGGCTSSAPQLIACTNSPAGLVGPDVGGAASVSPVPGYGSALAADFTITSKNGSWSITQAPSTVNVSCTLSVTYNGTAQTPCNASVAGVGGLSQPLSILYSNNTNAGTASAFASYAGDTDHSGGSYTAMFAIVGASSSTTVASSSLNNTSNYGDAVTFTATVTYPGTLGTLTGAVTFFSDGSPIGSGTLGTTTCGTTGCSAQTSFSTSTLPGGTTPNTSTTHSITAIFSGDGTGFGDQLSDFNPSTSAGISQIVNNVPLASVDQTGASIMHQTAVSFGFSSVGVAGSPMPIKVYNLGDANLVMGSPGFSITGPNAADFKASTNCASSLGFVAGSNSCTFTVTFTPSSAMVETATLLITDNNYGVSGSQQFVMLTGSGLSSITGNSLYTQAIFATSSNCGAITLSGGSSVDSFNSLHGGNVGTNGNINLSGGKTVIDGTAALNTLTTGSCSQSAFHGFTANGGAQVTGGLVALNGSINYPTPPAPNPVPTTTTQNIAGSCPAGMSGCSVATGTKAVSLAPGQYGNVTASGGTTVHFKAGTYNFNSLMLSGKSTLYVDSGPVIVNLAGAALSANSAAMDVSGGSIVNPSHVSANLLFAYGSSHGVTLSGGSDSYATVYAPNALVNISGGSDFFGSIIGNTVAGSGGTAIHYDSTLPNVPAGDTIWFTAVVNHLNLGTTKTVKLYMTNASISFTANGNPYTVMVPNGVVTLNSAASGATTIYDTTNSRWSTNINTTALTGNTFVSGVAFPVPSNFPTGIQNVTWSAAFSTDTPGISLQWQWNAAVYTNFGAYATGTNKNALGVNPEDGSADPNPPDTAGTPEAYKTSGTFGATSGYFSVPSVDVPTVAQISISPSSMDFGTQPKGTPSPSQTAVLTNNYSTPFTISAISVTGTNASDFTESDNCPKGVTNGFAGTSSCTITIKFTPSSGSGTPESAKIVISDTANNSPQTVYLTGTSQ